MKTFNGLHQEMWVFVRSKTNLPFRLDMYGGEKTKTVCLKIFKEGTTFLFMAYGSSVIDAMTKLLVKLNAPETSWEFPDY